jgi:hypothetical protein
MDELTVNQVYENVKSILNPENGTVQTVNKESRQVIQNSMSKSGLSPEQHAEAMRLISEKIKKEFELKNKQEV